MRIVVKLTKLNYGKIQSRIKSEYIQCQYACAMMHRPMSWDIFFILNYVKEIIYPIKSGVLMPPMSNNYD